MHDNYSTLFSFRSLLLTTLFITTVHDFKASSTKNVDELIDLNGHINIKFMFIPKGPTCGNTSSLEPVLFEKLQKLEYHIQYLGLPSFPNLLQQNLHYKFCFNMHGILKST